MNKLKKMNENKIILSQAGDANIKTNVEDFKFGIGRCYNVEEMTRFDDKVIYKVLNKDVYNFDTDTITIKDCYEQYIVQIENIYHTFFDLQEIENYFGIDALKFAILFNV